MAILLDHALVPSRHPAVAAKELADFLNVAWEERPPFFAVYVNDSLTLDFGERDQFGVHHYCFHVDEAEFDGILERIRAAGMTYRSSPRGPDDFQINRQLGGRNFYWTDQDGHVWEVLTVSYARPVQNMS